MQSQEKQLTGQNKLKVRPEKEASNRGFYFVCRKEEKKT